MAILLCDASEGVTSEDLRIGELAMKSGCATLVGLNKWDIVEIDLDDAKARLAQRLRQRPPVITCSATQGRNLQKLLPKALELADRRASRIRTSDLNRFLADAVGPQPAARQAAAGACAPTTSPRSGEAPPRFAVQVNDRKLISRDWAYYLENSLRESHGLEGVPLVIDFVPRRASSSGLGIKARRGTAGQARADPAAARPRAARAPGSRPGPSRPARPNSDLSFDEPGFEEQRLGELHESQAGGGRAAACARCDGVAGPRGGPAGP